MWIRNLTARRFRNLGHDQIRFGNGANLIVGGNGEGKTSLLEAISVLVNLRSFRTTRWTSVVRSGERDFGLLGELEGAVGRWALEQRVDVGPPLQRQLLIGEVSAGVERYLSIAPIATMSSSDSELVSGPPASRRALLDRFAFQIDSSTLAALRTFQRTLRQRNAALAQESSDAELDAWDERLAVVAAGVVSRRLRAVSSLQEAFATTYRRLRGLGFPEVTLGYRGEPWLEGAKPAEKLEESYRKRYNVSRLRDRHAGHSQEGPHRHDLRIEADDHPAREVLSSGQVKVAAAALRLATVLHVERERGERLPVMVDDVDAELDSEAFGRLAAALAGNRQLLLTSAHAEVVAPAFPGAAVLTMAGGRCGASGE